MLSAHVMDYQSKLGTVLPAKMLKKLFVKGGLAIVRQAKELATERDLT